MPGFVVTTGKPSEAPQSGVQGQRVVQPVYSLTGLSEAHLRTLLYSITYSVAPNGHDEIAEIKRVITNLLTSQR
jgi:hypothetical protein